MTTLSDEFKRKVADLYLQKRVKLEKYDLESMKSFASQLLEMVTKEKEKSKAFHDLEILEYNMKMLQNYATKLKGYKQDTDEYDFTRNDCKNLVDSTKKWLKMERLI
ncbi:MAG: hypothetical protein ACFFFC_19785 [Candidatus Thorarchaeota archaeon]